ncbi:hypothetical protein Patl1_23766 [Pistacia atlantica]|uniref:Uncharacterized protein n=1 Tax=Pistacia atlantica TaxID=434234 RepID=A0ACC1A096_9ROSI|nr:hypothetical protein Patl1_23766 [Pistacia atlantica]
MGSWNKTNQINGNMVNQESCLLLAEMSYFLKLQMEVATNKLPLKEKKTQDRKLSNHYHNISKSNVVYILHKEIDEQHQVILPVY